MQSVGAALRVASGRFAGREGCAAARRGGWQRRRWRQRPLQARARAAREEVAAGESGWRPVSVAVVNLCACSRMGCAAVAVTEREEGKACLGEANEAEKALTRDDPD